MTTTGIVGTTTIPPVEKRLGRIAFGGSYFGADQWTGDERNALTEAMEIAFAHGINHFDTAAGYGGGASERLLAEFVKPRREAIFLASKADVDEMSAAAMLAAVQQSLARLDTDYIDLFYIHWPRAGFDLRPVMEGLATAKARGLIRAIGVSNFSVADMEQVQEVGPIDAHQFGHNLIWRVAESEVLPYCIARGIRTTTYSSIAQGILTGKFGASLAFAASDHRNSIVLFRPDVWPHVHAAVQDLRALSDECGRSLVHLAIRWVLSREGIGSAVVGARTVAQAQDLVGALQDEIDLSVFDRLTAISDALQPHLPDTGNMYDHHP